MNPISIRRLTTLAKRLCDCVDGGASVSFRPLSDERARALWRDVAGALARDERGCSVIPGYALWSDGGLCATTVFFKPLAV